MNLIRRQAYGIDRLDLISRQAVVEDIAALTTRHGEQKNDQDEDHDTQEGEVNIFVDEFEALIFKGANQFALPATACSTHENYSYEGSGKDYCCDILNCSGLDLYIKTGIELQ